MFAVRSIAAASRRVSLTNGAPVRHSSTAQRQMFDKILIANRGEIACRVMRTAKKMGVKTVAVFSDADKNSMHTQLADEAYNIGPASSRESYLRMDTILDVAKRSGAKAIHPGYGFLSENAEFADYCAREGVVFIGPPASAIREMGSKSASKIIMSSAGVPVVGGYHGSDQSLAKLKAEADKIGYPVLIKAIMGGGGKGMRIVERPEDFEAMLESSRREAMKSFNDDKVLVEKYLLNPRHVEVQVFADMHGDAVYFYERDCSVQRRHQKIIEEAPAPGLSDAIRAELGEAAVRAAKAVKYVGAGTVEFIMDSKTRQFYFMEMNTRLQVEHPVSEMVTGADLVELQLKIASGMPLPMKQSDIKLNGHAFEARIYAENPAKNFLPGTGPLVHLRTAEPSDTVRIETGVRQGDAVTVHYDPMIAKLVVWGPDRDSALLKLRNCLNQYEIVGLNTNIQFLSDLAGHHAFRAGDVETGFIARFNSELFPTRQPLSDSAIAQATLGLLLRENIHTTVQTPNNEDTQSPWSRANSWRMNEHYSRRISLTDNGHAVAVDATCRPDGSYSFRIEHAGRGKAAPAGVVEARGALTADGALSGHIGEQFVKANVVVYGDTVHVFGSESQFHVDIAPPAYLSASKGGDTRTSVNAPMTGKIEKVHVKVGDAVEKDAPLVILEAMKMEHVIRSPFAGVIAKINFKAGELVSQDALLVEFQKEKETPAKK
eukprot:Opistho-2@57088